MAGERTFLQVPPDSTGKRVRMTHTAEIFYNNNDGYAFHVGERYYTTFSDNATYYVHVHGVHAINSSTGVLEVHYAKAAKMNNLTPTVGANLVDEDGVTVLAAQVESFRDIYINSNHIIGYDNPEYGVDVDSTGSMNIRFSEGLPQLDAFGKLRTSGSTILGDYVFSENTLPQYFTSTIWGRGRGSKITHDTNRHTLTLETPSTVTYGVATKDPDSGDMAETTTYSATHTTDTYHHYFPGFSHMAIMTAALGNTGVAGLAQQWGYFDDDNGYFFQVYDNGGLEFVIRSSATGDLTERRISRTQTTTYLNGVLDETTADGWNGDPVNGSGDSGKTLNLTDDNIYWIDIQWLGAGRVRFGTYHEGQRVVIHEYYHDNNLGFPHSQTGSLPLRFQQYNIANEVVASGPNYMRVWCASVVTESAVDLSKQGFGQVESFEVTFDPSNLNDYKGLNDTGFGDRAGVTKTTCTASAGSSTMTVPNVTDIKPGYRLHVMSGGTGTVDNTDMGTTVLEIVNSTTIILNKPVLTAFDGNETVRFHLNVDHEYHMIGVLAPVTYIGSQTNHKNRTIYQPKSMQAWAYHEDGTDAFCEIEVYTQPIISGNDKSITTSQANGGPLQSIEPNNPFAGTESYQFSDGLVNYFGSGYHNSINFCKGRTETIDISSGYGNYQAGAFKLASDNGGNNSCPVARVYQSPAAGVPTVIQINTKPTGVNFTNHRENDTALYFDGIPGAIGTLLNYSANGGQKFYVRHLDIEKLELYEDQAFTIPFDSSFATTGVDPSTNAGGTIAGAWEPAVAGGLTWPGNSGSVPTGGFIISGYGDQLYFAIVAKPVGPSATENWYKSVASGGHGPITVHFKLTWNEIVQ
jgi:hypothetical protein